MSIQGKRKPLFSMHSIPLRVELTLKTQALYFQVRTRKSVSIWMVEYLFSDSTYLDFVLVHTYLKALNIKVMSICTSEQSVASMCIPRGEFHHRGNVCMKFFWLNFKIFQLTAWKWWNSRKKVIAAPTITQGMTASLIYNRASLRASRKRIALMSLSMQEFHAADTLMGTVVLEQIIWEHHSSTLLIKKFKKVKLCYFCRGKILNSHIGVSFSLAMHPPHDFCLMWFEKIYI